MDLHFCFYHYKTLWIIMYVVDSLVLSIYVLGYLQYYSKNLHAKMGLPWQR